MEVGHHPCRSWSGSCGFDIQNAALQERLELGLGLLETLALLIKDQKARKANPDAFVYQLQKLKQRFQDIQTINYFQCSRGEDVQRLFQKAAALELPTKKSGAAKRLQVADYKGKLWLTRPRPEIDRVGSAWLIGKFIDPEAKFAFADTPTAQPEAIPYDMLRCRV
jgi:hypothetical protein